MKFNKKLCIFLFAVVAVMSVLVGCEDVLTEEHTSEAITEIITEKITSETVTEIKTEKQTEVQSVHTEEQTTEESESVIAVITAVYDTPTGKKYHYSKSCAGKNAFEVSLDDIKNVKDPCKRCVG